MDTTSIRDAEQDQAKQPQPLTQTELDDVVGGKGGVSVRAGGRRRGWGWGGPGWGGPGWGWGGAGVGIYF